MGFLYVSPARGNFQFRHLNRRSQTPHAPTAYILFTRLPSLSTNQAARSRFPQANLKECSNFLTPKVESRIEPETNYKTQVRFVDGSETLPREVNAWTPAAGLHSVWPTN
ncbi:uncharacterized protein BDZ99DRAFT_466355 [Mytilinidion resinicola]|uniref:Uncharacterized protein n=1 Tax=Mytilinidion resinicola TaxID=574789 RepID=A0A6A6YBW6_9PEZI|nr:uncharacterized protein BDZ99DRAFT_466355 [Mytilinidion resinicola]KAF2806068.1 hypothetical protein BDZ99DRAFT_466355 [Mytilinidion resinicola]